jgi:hypothetical protein
VSRLRATAALAALALAAAGCAGVPTDGDVHVGSSAPPAPQQQALRVIPRQPYVGQSPKSVVRGFLDASAAFDENEAAARRFLTSDAASTWNPQRAGITVYDNGADATGTAKPFVLTPTVSGNVATVRVSATRLASIGPDGAYQVASPHSTLKLNVRLAKKADGWRISQPPRRLLLTSVDILRSFQALNVYYLNRSGRFIVPDRVYLQAPVGGTATALIRSLLDGPSSWLSDAVQTAVPTGTTLLGNVPINDNGLAQVSLSQEALTASVSEKKLLVAQIVYTLRQLPSVTRVQITAGGTPLTQQASLSVVDYADSRDPAEVPATLRFVYTHGRKLRAANGKPVSGPLGRHDHGLRDVAISANGKHVAGIVKTGDGQGLWLGTTGPGPHTVAVTAAKLTPPSYDPAGRDWTVATTGSGQRVYAVARNGHDVLRARADRLLADGTISQLVISPDGARAVAVVNGKLLMGQVTGTSAHPALQHFRSIQPGSYTDAGDVTWLDTDTVGALMHPAGESGHTHELLPVSIAVDGSDPSAGTALPAQPTQIAAAPGETELVAAGKKIYAAAGTGWRAVATGANPAYPG